MWWWFRRREEKNFDDKWASLAASLKLSFSQVREDMNHLTDSDIHQHEKIVELYSKVLKLESRIDQMILAINLHQNHSTNNQLQFLPLQKKVEKNHSLPEQ